jgi:RimJ/RimL family protein N-acetyltransferase
MKLPITTDRLLITAFHPDMAESVHILSLDADNRAFLPDEVFETIAGVCHGKNIASRRVLEKCGFEWAYDMLGSSVPWRRVYRFAAPSPYSAL